VTEQVDRGAVLDPPLDTVVEGLWCGIVHRDALARAVNSRATPTGTRWMDTTVGYTPYGSFLGYRQRSGWLSPAICRSRKRITAYDAGLRPLHD